MEWRGQRDFNRAGKNLTPEDLVRLDQAKVELRKLFDRD